MNYKQDIAPLSTMQQGARDSMWEVYRVEY